MAPGFMSSAGQTYYDYLVSTFDCLYREGGKVSFLSSRLDPLSLTLMSCR